MALMRVIRPNDFYKVGTFLEEIGMNMVQPVRMLEDEGVLRAEANYGFAVPRPKIEDYAIQIMRRGLDKKW